MTYTFTQEYAQNTISSFCQQHDLEMVPISSFAASNLFYVLSKGDLTVRFPFSTHFEPLSGYLVIYTLEGEGKISTNDEEFILPRGKVLFIPCSHSISLEIYKSSSWHFDFFIINGNSIDAYYELYHENNYAICTPNPVSGFPHTSDKLLHHVFHSSSENELLISKLITDLLTELIVSKNAELGNVSTFPRYLLQIKTQFDEHFDEHFSLDELAETYHISKYKIIRDFTTYLHTSPINYLISKRMNAAQQLLRETEYPVYEVASRVGIDNINHFTNLFKRTTNLTPINYRKNSRYEHSECLAE